jgi:hypothetical protein
MRGANFKFAHLEAADLSLSEALASNFEHANLSGATLSGASLQGAMLLSANLDATRLKNTCIWQATVDQNLGNASGLGNSKYDPTSKTFPCEITNETINELKAGQDEFLEQEDDAFIRMDDDSIRKALASIAPDAPEISIPRNFLAQENFERYLAREWKVLSVIGCSRVGAPYVVQGILYSREILFPNNEHWADLANDWLLCGADEGMDPSLRAIIEDYRNGR